MNQLERLIHRCMAPTQLKIGAACPEVDYLKAEIKANDALRALAQAMLESTPPAIEDRDHISKWRNTLLRQALA